MHMRKLQVRWCWQNWTVGLVLPHGGMVVWCVALGPLWIEFWPLARKLSPL